MTLLIDNSNTRTKLAFSVNGELTSELFVIPTAELTADRLRKELRGYTIENVLVCSVVPSAMSEIRSAFEVPVEFLRVVEGLAADFRYETPATLGADRVANVLGGVEKGRFPFVAVDLGTAVTFDVVVPGNRKPCFIGGSIAPGLAAMNQYLSSKTAMLPEVTVSAPCPAIGGSTVAALQSGCFIGFCGMVREVLLRIEKELGKRPYVIATGGDAALVASELNVFDEVDTLLTFRGLNAACRNFF